MKTRVLCVVCEEYGTAPRYSPKPWLSLSPQVHCKLVAGTHISCITKNVGELAGALNEFFGAKSAETGKRTELAIPITPNPKGLRTKVGQGTRQMSSKPPAIGPELSRAADLTDCVGIFGNDPPIAPRRAGDEHRRLQGRRNFVMTHGRLEERTPSRRQRTTREVGGRPR